MNDADAVLGIQVSGYPTETAITQFYFSVPITRKQFHKFRLNINFKPYKYL